MIGKIFPFTLLAATACTGEMRDPTCAEIAEEAVRISEGELVKIYDQTLVSRTDTAVTCKGRGAYSDNSVVPLTFRFFIDKDGERLVSYTPDTAPSENPASEPPEADTPTALADPEVVLSCRGYDQQMPVVYCLGAVNHAVAGDFKIRSGGQVRAYTDADFWSGFNLKEVRLPLAEPFEVQAQVNGGDYSLRLEIRDKMRTLFSDEETSFGVIGVRSEDL